MGLTLLAFLTPLWPLIIIIVIIKIFPVFSGKLFFKAVDHVAEIRIAYIKDELARETAKVVEDVKASLTARIERDKAELSATYSTLQLSVNTIATGQTGMREGTISAVKSLWATILQIKDDFAGLVTLTTILSEDEISAIVMGSETGSMNGYVQKYRDENWLTEHSAFSSRNEIEMARLFCGDRLGFCFMSSVPYIFGTLG